MPKTKSPRLVGSSAVVMPSWDDWQEAYEEAAGHLCYVAATGANEIPDGERAAMYKLAERLRRNATRLKRHNDQAQRPPPETPGRLQQLRTNYPNRPTAQRGGGSLQRSG